jgi:NTE family protein
MSRTVASLEGVLVPAAALEGVPLFEGLGPDELTKAATSMRFREFPAGATICNEGAPGTSMLVLVEGLAHVLVAIPDEPELRSRSVFAEGRLVSKLRQGDVVGVMALLTGEPHTATVKAAVNTAGLELDDQGFRELVSQSPQVLVNLTRVLGGQLATATKRQAERGRRGEAVALVADPSLAAAVPGVVGAAEAASPRPVRALDTRDSVQAALDGLDEALLDHGTVILLAELDQDDLALLAEHVDRAVALLRAGQGELPGAFSDSAPLVEVVRLGEGPPAADTVRMLKGGANGAGGLSQADVGWLGRHLARTKLGLALGAGGAKGYAHVGVLRVLEEAGYVVDAVGGASIGAIVGAYVALGMTADEIERTLHESFSPEANEQIFSLSLAGTSTGLEVITRIFRETTRDLYVEDTLIPLVCMAVDLTARSSAPIREGPIWEALRASTALAGMFPPYQRDGHRLVDGVALVPVPTDAVRAAGADVVLSVNLMSRETLPAWPGQESPPEEEARKKPGSRMLETILEVMDLSQLDTSVRHAELADVVVTPRFGPGSWRDFHLADLFLEAGRMAADESLPVLESLARPQMTIPS